MIPDTFRGVAVRSSRASVALGGVVAGLAGPVVWTSKGGRMNVHSQFCGWGAG